MDKKVQKVIYKLIKLGDKELANFENDLLQDKFNQNMLIKTVILLYFKQVNFDGNIIEDDKRNVDILFLDPMKVFTALDEIYISIKEQVAFLEWYLERTATFYTTKSLEHYVQVGCALTYKVNTYLGFSESKKQAIYKRIKKSDETKRTYDFYKTIFQKMKALYRVGILYTQQYELLSKIGMQEEMIKQLKNYQIFSLLELNTPNTLEVKKEKQIDVKRPIKNSLREVAPQNLVSHRTIKEKLSKYLDCSTLENKTLIEGDIFSEVDSLLRQIYPEIKVNLLEKRIIANNAEMKKKMYISVRQELLPCEEDYQLLLDAQNFLQNDLGRDSFFSPYYKIVQEIVLEIDSYLYSYLSLNSVEKDGLKEDYINLIVLSLNRLRPHLDFLPFHEGSPLL